MPRFRPYNPDQAYLLPPSVRDALGEEHLCFFVRELVERLDHSAFLERYGEEGHPGYAPQLMLKVWLYGYLLGITSSRRLEQRIREDLGYRYLAGGPCPDYWALNDFRRRHLRALNDVFTQVVELARDSGLGKLGHVAIDSTRVGANACRGRVDRAAALRNERARLRRWIRRWQQQCNAEQEQEAPGTQLSPAERKQLQRRLEEIPRQLRERRKNRLKQASRTDPESRFLRDRRGFVLRYSAEVAVTEDHLVVAQRVTQNASDNESLAPMVQEVEERCGEAPRTVSADSGYFKLEQIERVEARGAETYVPDANLGYELKGKGRVAGIGKNPVRNPLHEKLRRRLRSE
jgi:transposase